MHAPNTLKALGCISVISLVSLVAIAGCSAENVTDHDDDVNVAAQDESVTERARTPVCNADQNAAHRTATQLLRFVFGDDASAPPAACADLKAALLGLRAMIADPRITITHSTAPNVVGCGENPPMYTFQTSDPRSFPLNPGPTQQGINSCYANANPGMVNLYFMPYGTPSYISLDPEPATLTANLAATSGATAAAYYSDSLIETNVKYRPSPGACGALVGGEPCATSALAIGAITPKMVLKSGSICTCR